ncbi:MAG: class I SAM-dependent methyltransferase [Planctomycetaceae bacterium]
MSARGKVAPPDEAYYRRRIIPFNRSWKGRGELDEAVRVVRERVASGRVLDLGCGPGLNAQACERRVPGWRMVAADAAPSAVRIAAEAAVERLVRVDAHDLCFADASFAAVLMTHVVGHLADPRRGLEEVRRVLEPGGVLALTTPNGRFVELFRVFNERGIIPYRRDPTVLRTFDAGELRRALLAAAFEVLELRCFGSLPLLDARLLDMGLLPPGVRLDDETRRERIFALARRPSA